MGSRLRLYTASLKPAIAPPSSGDFRIQLARSSSAKAPIRLMARSYAGAHKSVTRSRNPTESAGETAGRRCGQGESIVVPGPLHQHPVRDSFQRRLDFNAVWSAFEGGRA